MTLNDLLLKQGIDPVKAIVMRHRPDEPGLRKVLPWMVHARPEVFNAYQQSHNGRQEEALRRLAGHGWLVSFLGLVPGEAVFCGLFEIRRFEELNKEKFWAIPENSVLREHGMLGWARKGREQGLWFDLALLPIHSDWIGKLIIKWPPPERSWWRRADRNVIEVKAIREESAFAAAMPDWRDMVLSWAELRAIPESWRHALAQWRGIYFIHDVADGRGYVGSAYGKENILGRWLNYSARGHGGNKLLRSRKPDNFRFSILELVSPDMAADDVIHLETRWKTRIHTRGEFGLNVN